MLAWKLAGADKRRIIGKRRFAMQDVFDSDVIMEIKDEETWEQKVDNAPGRVMVEFFVTWCPHC